jgi:cytochrome c biogenesis protein CcmG/thiol:disulfide interchange protein DsbE
MKFSGPTRRRVATFILTVGMAAGLAGAVQASAEYDAALARRAQMTENLQAYDIQGTLTVAVGPKEGGDGGMTFDAEFDVAARWPDRLINLQTSDMFQQHMGTGPDMSWFYVSQFEAAYQGGPVQLSRDLEQAEAQQLEAASVFNFFAGLSDLMLPTDLELSGDVGAETLALGDREVACQVFHVAGETELPESGEPVMGPRTYWFDPASGLCLQTETTVFGRQGPMEIRQQMTYRVTSMQLDGQLDDSRFTYVMPQGVRVVDSFERVMNPDAMTGMTAPDVTLTDLEGGTFQLSDLRGKVVFLDLWATWCGPCRMEMPHIEALHKELGPEGEVVFVAASSEDKATITGFLAKNPYTFRIAMISQDDAIGKFKAASIPTGFVIDREGVIQAHLVGAQNEAQLRAALAKAGIQ